MKSMMKIRQQSSGFTLIEVMVVIVIIAVLAAIAIPAFSGWLPDYRLRRAARDLYSNLQRAKIGAIKSNSEWRVYFDNSVNPGRYFLCSGPGANAAWDTPPALGGDDDVEMTLSLSDYEGVDFGNGDAPTNIDGDPFGPAIDYAPNPLTNFTPRGTVNFNGYVYISNSKGTVFGVGTPSPAGVVIIRKYSGGGWG
jgi:prepilin-type N-terminal cleavage/methylation domain-containing protein